MSNVWHGHRCFRWNYDKKSSSKDLAVSWTEGPNSIVNFADVFTKSSRCVAGVCIKFAIWRWAKDSYSAYISNASWSWHKYFRKLIDLKYSYLELSYRKSEKNSCKISILIL